MFEDIQRHFSHYLILFTLLLSGLVFFLLSSHEPTLQLQIVTMTTLLYVLWGVLHHFLEKNLTWIIVLEYVSIAVLALVIVYNLLTRI